MTIYFTSDTHFSHENIIRYCNRPFKDIDHMNAAIIENWNNTVEPQDTVFHLGDVALGEIDKSLACVSRLNGYKICVLGNHDRPFMRAGKMDERSWWNRYSDVFQEVWHWKDPGNKILLNGQEFNLSHFPYSEEGMPERGSKKDRHMDQRPVDDGTPLIHGHTHIVDQHHTLSPKGTPQIHVGQDAWNFTPVSEDQIMNLYVRGS